MFGTEIKPTTFVFICIELIVLFFQVPNYLSRRQDKSRLRFLILVIVYLFYNLCSGLFPNEKYPIHILIQNIFAFGSGILLATYYFYYLVKELNIAQEKLFNTKVLFWSLVLSFVIGFILTYLITDSISISKRNFIVMPVLISIYFCITTIKFLAKKRRKQVHEETPFKLMVYSGYIGIIFMATMPVVVFFGDYQTINNGLVNISFVITFYAYIKYYLFQSKVEYNLLKKAGFLTVKESQDEKLNDWQSELLGKSGLTSRELDIAYLILKNMTYEDIALETFITPKTVSKHASNIYKKTDSANKKAFIEKFAHKFLVVETNSEIIDKQIVTKNTYENTYAKN